MFSAVFSIFIHVLVWVRIPCLLKTESPTPYVHATFFYLSIPLLIDRPLPPLTVSEHTTLKMFFSMLRVEPRALCILSVCSTTELPSKPEFLEICMCVLIMFNSVFSECGYTCKPECRCLWKPGIVAPLELELQAGGTCLM